VARLAVWGGGSGGAEGKGARRDPGGLVRNGWGEKTRGQGKGDGEGAHQVKPRG